MGKHDLSERVNRFWLRVTEGMQLNQLWSQFRTDAHSSYRLYSLEVDSTRVEGVDHTRHFLRLGSKRASIPGTGTLDTAGTGTSRPAGGEPRNTICHAL